jgi:Protein of unknown function (DUF3108)
MVARLNFPTRLGYGVMAVLVLLVVVLHGCVLDQASQYLIYQPKAPIFPPRMQAVYVQSLKPMVPALTTSATTPSPRRSKPKVFSRLPKRAQAATPQIAVPARLEPQPQGQLSSALVDHDEPAQLHDTDPTSTAQTDPALQQPPPQVVDTAIVPSPGAQVDSTTQTSQGTSSAFEWPQATRLKFDLTGNYKGDIQGRAQVEWLREQDHYQVHLDVRVGLPFAPIMSRRMSSEGVITAQGLVPHRYDQETKIAFSAVQHATVQMEADSVKLANGRRVVARWPDLQDSASQFIQLSWRLSTQPELGQVGRTIVMPLALPGRLSRSVYDITEQELLSTSFGKVPVLHLVPRPDSVAPGDLAVEMWLAPQYRYLPMKLRIRQDAQTYVDLMVSAAPQAGSIP